VYGIVLPISQPSLVDVANPHVYRNMNVPWAVVYHDRLVASYAMSLLIACMLLYIQILLLKIVANHAGNGGC
jgi:hypothetical protein